MLVRFYIFIFFHFLADIVFVYSNNFDLIWTDKGSIARKDVSIWKVQNYLTGFCSLGDIATEGRRKPKKQAILVKAIKPDSLTRYVFFHNKLIFSNESLSDCLKILSASALLVFSCHKEVSKAQKNDEI